MDMNRGEGGLSGGFFAEFFGKIGHLLEALGFFLVKPTENLDAGMAGRAPSNKKVGQLVPVEIEKVQGFFQGRLFLASFSIVHLSGA